MPLQQVLINAIGICKLKYFLLEPLTYKKYVKHNGVVYHECALASYSNTTMMIIKMRYDNIQLFPKVNYDKEYVDLISMCTKMYNLFTIRFAARKDKKPTLPLRVAESNFSSQV